MHPHPELTTIEASMRAVGRQERQVVSLPHFELFISPAQQDHLSFAVPLSGNPADWRTAVPALLAACAEHGKQPRLEYIVDLHPGLADALTDAGLSRESANPVMLLEMEKLAARSSSPTSRYRRLDAADEPLLRAFLVQQSIAFGGEGGADAFDWLPNLRHGLATDGVIGAVLEDDGALLSGAIIQIGAGIGELAGVWTSPAHRSRGLAFALCRRLLAEYAAAGYAHCWLSAAPGAQQLYAKLGFVVVGTQLNVGRGP